MIPAVWPVLFFANGADRETRVKGWGHVRTVYHQNLPCLRHLILQHVRHRNVLLTLFVCVHPQLMRPLNLFALLLFLVDVMTMEGHNVAMREPPNDTVLHGRSKLGLTVIVSRCG